MSLRQMAVPLALAFAASVPLTAQAQEVTVGAALALTGAYAFAGVPSRDGMLVALDEVNATPGTKIKLQIEDTASEKTQAITLTNRFGGNSQYVMMLGPSSSSEGVAIAPVANAEKIPLLTTTAVADDITKAGQWAFKTPSSPSAIIEAVAKYAVDRAGVKKVALVFSRDNEGQIGQKDVAKKYFQSRGVEIVAEESVLTSDNEFLAIITKLSSINPDAIFTPLVAEQGANFIVQARQAGMSPKVRFFGSPTMGSERFIVVGGKAVEGATFAADYFPGATTAENKRFLDAFQAKYKRLPDNWAALGYSAVKVAATGIRQAGAKPTRDSVRDALAKTKDLSVVLGDGKFSFDENRNSHYGAFVLTVKDGKFVATQ